MQSRLPANRRNSVNGRGLEAAFLTIGGSFPRLPPSPLLPAPPHLPDPSAPSRSPDQCWRCAPPPAIRAAPLCPASCYIHEDRGRRSTRWRTLEPLLPGHRTLDGKNPTALTACRPLLPLPAPCSTKCVLNPHPSFSSTQVGAMLRNFPQARRLLRCAPSVPVYCIPKRIHLVSDSFILRCVCLRVGGG